MNEKMKLNILDLLLEKFTSIDFYAESNKSHVNDRHQFSKIGLSAMPELSIEPDDRDYSVRERKHNDDMERWKKKNANALEFLRYLHETKISLLQYESISLREIIKQIESQNIIICDGKDSVFLYNGRWEEVDKVVFADFLVKASVKMGAPDFDKKEMLKQFINQARPQFLDERSEVTKAIRTQIEKQ